MCNCIQCEYGDWRESERDCNVEGHHLSYTRDPQTGLLVGECEFCGTMVDHNGNEQ